MATIENKFRLGANGPFGYPHPGFHTNFNYGFPFGATAGAGLLTTATRLYYIPFYIHSAITFNRAYTWNYDNAETGETYRTGVYTNDPAAGPKTLISDFGQVTLTAAAASRAQTISFDTSSYLNQWVWLAVHTNTAIGLGLTTMIAASTEFNPSNALFGAATTSFHAADIVDNPFRYVDTAYGALASTAVAPTAALRSAPTIRLGVV